MNRKDEMFKSFGAHHILVATPIFIEAISYLPEPVRSQLLKDSDPAINGLTWGVEDLKDMLQYAASKVYEPTDENIVTIMRACGKADFSASELISYVLAELEENGELS